MTMIYGVPRAYGDLPLIAIECSVCKRQLHHPQNQKLCHFLANANMDGWRTQTHGGSDYCPRCWMVKAK